MLDSTRWTGSTSTDTPRAWRGGLPLRWTATAAALALALLAGALLELGREDHDRATLVWLLVVAAAIAGAVACATAVARRDAERIWDLRRETALAQAAADAADRGADACCADDVRSRELLQRLQAATTEALHDPFLADRLTRTPRDEQDLLALLREIDRHLARRPPGD